MKFFGHLALHFLFSNFQIVATATNRHLGSLRREVSEPIVFDQNIDPTNNEDQEVKIYAMQLESRIVGGGDAAAGEFPFMVAWSWDSPESSGCGGSLVAPNLVLTAAHCQENTGSVRIGSRYRNPGDATEWERIEIRDVVEKIRHPSYHARSLQNDFLLLELNSDIDTDFFPPINLNFDKQQPFAGDFLTVIGFGETSENGENPEILQKVSVAAFGHQACDDAFGWMVKEDISLCAGYNSGGKDACAGDSGGPLFKEINGITTQVGVVSWGIGCAREGNPGIYARISGAEDWLKDEICSRSHDPQPSYCPTPEPQPTRSPIRPPTEAPTQFPTRLPTNRPTSSSSAPQTCKTCSDTACNTTPDILERACNKNEYWTENRICELQCFLAGYGYPGEEPCCTNDAIFTDTAPTDCIECTDKGDPWMQNQNIACQQDEILVQRKCNRREFWRMNKFCQYSCYMTGYGYDGDICCTS